MSNRRKRTYAAALAALVAMAVATWLWVSPSLTLRDMRDAAGRGDAQAIDAHIDYDALRMNLKTQIKQRIRAKIGTDAGPAARQLTELANGQVDALVTTESLHTMIAGVDAANPGLMKAKGVVITRTGITTFIAGTPSPTGATGGVEFTLQGLTWRITGIRIPDLP